MRLNQLNHLITCVDIELRELGITMGFDEEVVVRNGLNNGQSVQIELHYDTKRCSVRNLGYVEGLAVSFVSCGVPCDALQKRFDIAFKSKAV